MDCNGGDKQQHGRPGAEAEAQGHLNALEWKGTPGHKNKRKEDSVHLGTRSRLVSDGEGGIRKD